MTLSDATLAAWHESAATLAAGPRGGTLSVEAADIAALIDRLELAEAVAQAAEACMNRQIWIGYSEGGIDYCNDCEVLWTEPHKPGCSVLAMLTALAALRALVGDATPWADQEADVQPSRG